MKRGSTVGNPRDSLRPHSSKEIFRLHHPTRICVDGRNAASEALQLLARCIYATASVTILFDIFDEMQFFPDLR